MCDKKYTRKINYKSLKLHNDNMINITFMKGLNRISKSTKLLIFGVVFYTFYIAYKHKHQIY